MQSGRREEPEAAYLRRKEEQLAHGHPFFPETVFKDVVAAALVIVAVVALALLFGAPLELEANPAGSVKAPRPEWYFLFLFEALKYLPGSLEWVGAVVVPTLFIAALFLVPLYDRSGWRHPLNRPFATGLAVIILLAVALLTYRAATTPEPPAVGAPGLVTKSTPLEQAGRRVYDDKRCAVCHKINGVGGAIGPELSLVGRSLDAAWLVAHLEKPAEIVPGTRMPQITLANEELMSLTAYLLSLTEPETRTPAQLGEAIFAVYCSACHPGGKSGLGPPLIGLTGEQVTRIVRNGGAGMPAFGPGELSDEQVATIVDFLKTVK